MISAQQRAYLIAADCEVAFDNLTRRLHATDASIYQIEPVAVAFPRTATQASSVIRSAADADIPLIPRGAGTGLVGGALGDGLIVEFARYNRDFSDLDLEKRTVRVGAGVVLDQLNAFLKPHGFCFGPDVATSSRATLGGMIANNSSGAHVPNYGTTVDHVVSLEIVLADGRIKNVGAAHDTLGPQRELIAKLVHQHAAAIAEHMPEGLLKRWPGYPLDRYLVEQPSRLFPGRLAPGPNNSGETPGRTGGTPVPLLDLTQILCGSEGTLAGIVSAELKIVPLPGQKGLGLIFFSSVAEAMAATVALLDLKPAAIEHVDHVLLDQTQGQLQFQAARDFLGLDSRPCESILMVEFFEDVPARLADVAKRQLGLRTIVTSNAMEMNLVWGMRKAGLSLLTGRKGAAKPVTGIEDTAVRPEQLPAYVAGLESIMKPLDLEVCYYGHAATGLLHVRPVLDLHSAADLQKFRQVADQVSALVRQFKGSIAAEHGVGIARTEYMVEHVGSEVLDAFKQIKHSFDPKNLFNPGKIIPDGRYKIDSHLRMGAGYELKLPFTPVLAFAAKDESFVANLEQCNGCGGCRKDAPTMCPTFVVTGDEIMSTRGRANVIRAVVEQASRLFPGRLAPGSSNWGETPGWTGGTPIPLLDSPELDVALSNCLSCKACTAECPSNVNMALLKAELLHARHQRDGLPLLERLLSSVDLLGRVGCLMPQIANPLLDWPWLRGMLAKTLGLADQRPLPHYADERFDHWFASRSATQQPTRGRVFLWDDTFVRYYEPEIGRAAVAVLEAAGFEVVLLHGRQCCGRPAFSQGYLDKAARLGRHNLNLLQDCEKSAPILFLEPSCYSMFVEDYRELRLAGADQVAKRCVLFEKFVDDLLTREPRALQFDHEDIGVAIHAHCHAKSLMNPSFMTRLISRLPGRKPVLLDTGCCGMAGAFGALESKYELSVKVARPLIEKIAAQPSGTVVVASGTSCRHQIEHLTAVEPKHMVEVLAEALEE